MAVGPDGTVYFASSGSVRYVDADGDLQTLAADIGASYVAVRPDGVVFANATQDTNACPGATTQERIVQIHDGIVSNFLCELGPGADDTVNALAVAQDGGVYYSEIYSVWKVSPAGSRTLIAGLPYGGGGKCQQAGDPPNWTHDPLSCAFDFPNGLVAFGSGVLVAVTNWHQVRYVAGGYASNFAGTMDLHYSGDGGSAVRAACRSRRRWRCFPTGRC